MIPAQLTETHLEWAQNELIGDLLCGCGSPEDGVALIQGVLALMPLYEGRWKAAEALIGSPGAAQIVLNALSNADLIEHGGGIYGSWITEKGTRLLEILRVASHEKILNFGQPWLDEQ